MNIVVCCRAHPDTATRIRIAASGTVDRSRRRPVRHQPVRRVRRRGGDPAQGEGRRQGHDRDRRSRGRAEGHPRVSREGMRRGGPDRAGVDPVDGLQVAKLLAAEIGALGADAVFCGKQAVDDDSAAVGPMLGALLKMPCVTKVAKLEVDRDVVRRDARDRRRPRRGRGLLSLRAHRREGPERAQARRASRRSWERRTSRFGP